MPASSVAERRRGDEDLRDWWQYLVHERDRPIETRRRSLERQHNAFLIGVDLAKARPDVEVNTPYDPDAWRMDLEQDHSPDHGHPTLLSLSLHETVPSSSSPTYDHARLTLATAEARELAAQLPHLVDLDLRRYDGHDLTW